MPATAAPPKRRSTTSSRTGRRATDRGASKHAGTSPTPSRTAAGPPRGGGSGQPGSPTTCATGSRAARTKFGRPRRAASTTPATAATTSSPVSATARCPAAATRTPRAVTTFNGTAAAPSSPSGCRSRSHSRVTGWSTHPIGLRRPASSAAPSRAKSPTCISIGPAGTSATRPPARPAAAGVLDGRLTARPATATRRARKGICDPSSAAAEPGAAPKGPSASRRAAAVSATAAWSFRAARPTVAGAATAPPRSPTASPNGFTTGRGRSAAGGPSSRSPTFSYRSSEGAERKLRALFQERRLVRPA